MKTLGTKYGAILSWHRRHKRHPIFNSAYTRENIVSIGQTIVMLYFYLICWVMLLHLLATLGFMKSETLIWYVVEVNAQRLYFAMSPNLYLNPFIAFGFLMITVLATVVLHFAFDLLKANLHPEARKSFAKYLRSYSEAVKPRSVWRSIKRFLSRDNVRINSKKFIYNLNRSIIKFNSKFEITGGPHKTRGKNSKLTGVFRASLWLCSRWKQSLYLYSKAFQARVRENKLQSNHLHKLPGRQSLPQSSTLRKLQTSSSPLPRQNDD